MSGAGEIVAALKQAPWRIALIYAIFGALWIGFSDQALAWFIEDPATLTRAQMVKGWAFVLVTATLVFGLVYRHTQRVDRLQNRVRQSEEHFRQIVNASRDALLVFDEDWRLTDVNPAGAAMFRWTGVESTRLGLADLVTEECRDAIEELRARHAEDQDYLVEVTAQRHDGSTFPAEIHGGALYLHGRRKCLVAIRDISKRKVLEVERRRVEQKMLQTQKLESLGVLAGGIAHDFNNLLVTMMGNAELTQMALTEDHEASGYIEDILKASQRAAELCQQMLAYSGRGQFVIEVKDLNALIMELLPLLKFSIAKGADLRCDLASDLPPVEVDVAQIRQVIMNIITNASDALGEKDGRITVKTQLEKLTEADLAACHLRDGLAAGEYVALSVRDTGAGMTPEVLDRIFDPFYTSKFTGRGLGLAAVLGIVRGHKGDLRIDTAPGEGTTFTVMLPPSTFEGAAPKTPDSRLEEEAPCSGAVLVVDDEEFIRDTARRILERAGFTVRTAQNGEEALAAIGEEGAAIDAVLLDMTMPRMSGQTVFRELRALDGDLPVVLSSGYSERDVATRFEGQGLAGFLHKPYRAKELVRAMRKAVTDGQKP